MLHRYERLMWHISNECFLYQKKFDKFITNGSSPIKVNDIDKYFGNKNALPRIAILMGYAAWPDQKMNEMTIDFYDSFKEFVDSKDFLLSWDDLMDNQNYFWLIIDLDTDKVLFRLTKKEMAMHDLLVKLFQNREDFPINLAERYIKFMMWRLNSTPTSKEM